MSKDCRGWGGSGSLEWLRGLGVLTKKEGVDLFGAWGGHGAVDANYDVGRMRDGSQGFIILCDMDALWLLEVWE